MEAPVSTNYFTDLYRVNVAGHIEKKSGFSYVSWPFAVAELRKRHPSATWEVVRFDGMPYLKTEAGYFVEVRVTVEGVTLSQIHPVLDNRNQPIKAPNAFQINTSIQRALVKAIALHGLGLFVYAGEDLPEDEAQDKKPRGASEDQEEGNPLTKLAPQIQAKVRATAAAAIQAFSEGQEWTAYEEASSLWNQYPEGDERNKVKLAIAHILKPHSALRASLKASAEQERANAKETA